MTDCQALTKLAYLLGSSTEKEGGKNPLQLISQNLRGELTVPDKRQVYEHSEESISERHRLTDLLWAIRDDDVSGVRSSLDDDTINAYSPEGATPLILASQLGHVEIVRILLDNGAFVFAKTKDSGHSALYFAQKNEFQQIQEVLMQSGAHLAPGEILTVENRPI